MTWLFVVLFLTMGLLFLGAFIWLFLAMRKIKNSEEYESDPGDWAERVPLQPFEGHPLQQQQEFDAVGKLYSIDSSELSGALHSSYSIQNMERGMKTVVPKPMIVENMINSRPTSILLMPNSNHDLPLINEENLSLPSPLAPDHFMKKRVWYKNKGRQRQSSDRSSLARSEATSEEATSPLSISPLSSVYLPKVPLPGLALPKPKHNRKKLRDQGKTLTVDYSSSRYDEIFEPPSSNYLGYNLVRRSSSANDLSLKRKQSLVGCLTCELIQMGSASAYGDNTCPQCGRQRDFG